MSFDQLPDELIALVASHLHFTDIPKLLQSQKRICRILKTYKMDKPEFEEIVLIFCYNLHGWKGQETQQINPDKKMLWKLTCRVKETNYSATRLLFSNFYEEEIWNDVLDFISKACSINSLIIRGQNRFICLTEKFVTSFNLLNTKIEKFTIERYRFILSDDSFIQFIKNFSSVGLVRMVVVNKQMYENLLSRMLSATKLHVFCPGLGVEVSQMFTKETFKAAILSHKFYNFKFEFRSYLTVNEIRYLVESVIRKKAVFRMCFGELQHGQLNDANAWLQNVEENPNLPYKMESFTWNLMAPKTVFKKCILKRGTYEQQISIADVTLGEMNIYDDVENGIGKMFKNNIEGISNVVRIEGTSYTVKLENSTKESHFFIHLAEMNRT